MTYEIDYFSLTGNTRKLAIGISQSLFAGKVPVIDLSAEEISADADVHLVGFGLKNGVVPYPIMECLELLEGKTILFFVTCGIDPSDEYRQHIERKLAPFMPEQCDYKGMFLCPGQFPQEAMEKAQQAAAFSKNDAKAEEFLKHCREANGHPTQQDIAQACAFIQAKLTIY